MKRISIFIALLLFSTTLLASPIKRVVFFGDSLTDNGNLYTTLLHVLPKSPPYYAGRFSNGFVWSDYLGAVLKGLYNTRADNYAVGGATAVFHNPFKGFVPYWLNEEINHYLFHTMVGGDRSQTLFIIWMGANDYLSGQSDVSAATNEVVGKIMEEVNRLAEHGGRFFLILNLPDLAKVPYARGLSIASNLHDLGVAHNQKLEIAVAHFAATHKDIKIALLDGYKIFNEVLAHPDIYNKKYNVSISNVTDACWMGGYHVQGSKETQQLSQQLRHAFLTDTKPVDLKEDATALAYRFLNTPDTAEVYRVQTLSDEGVKPCAAPDTYAFWDQVHPSTVVHQVMAHLTMEKLIAEKFIP